MKSFSIPCIFLLAASSAVQAFTAIPQRASMRHVDSALHVDAGVTDVVVQAWTSYNIALEEDPLLTKSVTAGVILGAADLAGQAIQNARKDDGEKLSIDVGRFARFAFFGFILQNVSLFFSKSAEGKTTQEK